MIYKKAKSIINYKPYEEFKDIFVVRFKKDLKQAVNGKYYFEVKIQDANGEAMLKYWGSADKAKVEETLNSINADSVIYAEGKTSEFNDKIDFSVNEGKLKMLSEGEYNLGDFIRTSEKDNEEMLTELKKHIASIKDPELAKVLNAFFSDAEFVEKFKKSPAAMYIHHSWVSGLLEHTLTVVNICLDVAKHHSDLNRDFLIAGAVLHDIGKIDEFAVTTLIKVTDKGNLLSHTILGLQNLTQTLNKLDISDNTKTKLTHILISHHGLMENGCPKPPMTPEALLIAKADDLDASLVAMLDLKKTAQTKDSFAHKKYVGSVYLK
ncbi:MAG: HD domain-containing protein [Candidatus Diapherotrites archaeon]